MNISEIISCDNYVSDSINTLNVSSLVGSVVMISYSPDGLSTTTIPGYLVCDGSFVNISSYRNLYNFLTTNNTNYPVTGSGQFQLPDLRGVFLRAMPMGTGNDPDGGSGRSANTYQGYAMKRLTGRTNPFQNDYHALRNADGSFWTDTSTGDTDSNGGDNSCVGSQLDTGIQTTINNSECRPNNMSFLACIKY
jgi:microcystin-dependent protein